MSALRTFENQTAQQVVFQVLSKTFFESYESVIRNRGRDPFVKVYRQDGSMIDRTFQEFDEDVGKTRQFLLRSHHDQTVLATRCGNTYEHLVFIVAILTAGFQFCPLSPNDSDERTRQKLAQLPSSCHLLEKLEIPTHQTAATEKSKVRQEGEPFILVFTSGSTGYSKIVAQSEVGVLSNVEGLLRHHQLQSDRVSIGTPLPLFHVNALEFSFFVSLLGGQRLVLYESFDLLQILRSLEEDHIQIFSAVPHLYYLMARQIQKLSGLNLPKFRYFVSAAGPLPAVTIEIFARHQFKMIQGYGLSEAVNFSLKTPVHLSIDQIMSLVRQFGRPPVGLPIWGNEVFILNENSQECDAKVVGEICIRGINVMLGLDDDFLRTGDLGFWVWDENRQKKIFFVSGRVKDIAKRYGATVSLVEIDEKILPLLPAGADAISVNFENMRAGEEIGLVLKGVPDDFDEKVFFEGLVEKLGEELCPAVLAISADPLRTESGKPVRWKFREVLMRFMNEQKGLRRPSLLDLRKASK